MNIQAVRALTLARLREISREPGTLFWAFGFPLLLSLGLGLAFRDPAPPPPKVGVGVDLPARQATSEVLQAAGLIAVNVADGEAARRDLRDGRLDVLLESAEGPNADVGAKVNGHTNPTAKDPGYRFIFDGARPASLLARARVNDVLQAAAGRHDPRAVEDVPVSAAGERYIDFLVPGLIGMNVMSGSMWSLAFAVVSFRVRKLLKRLFATPLRRHELFASILAARLLILPVEIAVLLLVTHLAFHVPLRGSVLLLLGVATLGCLSFGGLAVLVASRAPNVEIVTGLMNAVMLPMFVVSGVFFPSSRFPAFIQPLLSLLPLTALNTALRAILLEGAGSADIARPCLCLAAWGLIAGYLGLRRFRWV